MALILTTYFANVCRDYVDNLLKSIDKAHSLWDLHLKNDRTFYTNFFPLHFLL